MVCLGYSNYLGYKQLHYFKLNNHWANFGLFMEGEEKKRRVKGRVELQSLRGSADLQRRSLQVEIVIPCRRGCMLQIARGPCRQDGHI